MKLIQVNDSDEMAELVATMILNKVRSNPKAVLGLATGGTPLKTYQQLISKAKNDNTSFRHVKTFNLDEYIGLERNNPNSYYHYMKTNLFEHIDFSIENFHIPNGMASDLSEECLRYDRLLANSGGIDLQILGIGTNGHIGFNEPGTSFSTLTHVVELAEATRLSNARYFANISEVPTNAITMGIGSILKSKEILLLVSGKNKAEILEQLLAGEPDPSLPGSSLKLHDNVTIIADEGALRKEVQHVS